MLEYQHATDDLRMKLGKLPDLEKMLAKIFTYSVKQKVTPISYEDISVQKMREFRTLLTSFKNLEDILCEFTKLNKMKLLKSKRLNLLLTEESETGEGGLLPNNCKHIITEFEKLIVWRPVPGSKSGADTAMPKPGLDDELDIAIAKVDAIKQRLDDYLFDLVLKFGNDERIKYTHILNRYEIEFPKEHVEGDKKPLEFEFSS